jgi:hypothetical protein
LLTSLYPSGHVLCTCLLMQWVQWSEIERWEEELAFILTNFIFLFYLLLIKCQNLHLLWLPVFIFLLNFFLFFSCQSNANAQTKTYKASAPQFYYLLYCMWMEPYPHHQQLANHNSETLLDLISTAMDVNYNQFIM